MRSSAARSPPFPSSFRSRIRSSPHLAINRLIESQFSNVNASYYSFNSTRLDAAQSAVQSFIQNSGSDMKHAPGYLMATLSTANATATAGPTPAESASASPSPSAGSGGTGGTGLAMSVWSHLSPLDQTLTVSSRIILYSITGCVSALFIIVILSGVRIWPLPLVSHFLTDKYIVVAGYPCRPPSGTLWTSRW
jgi:hypothetical protein